MGPNENKISDRETTVAADAGKGGWQRLMKWIAGYLAVRCIAGLGLRRNVHGALDCSRVACDLERVEVLLELNGPAAADRPNVGDLCFAFLSLPVKPEVIVAESHNFLAAVGLKDIVRVKDEFVEARR